MSNDKELKKVLKGVCPKCDQLVRDWKPPTGFFAPEAYASFREQGITMSDIDAIAYRTPACDAHLEQNDSDECPWCRIAELEAQVKASEQDAQTQVDYTHYSLDEGM